MELSDYRERIKLQLFAGILNPELDDATLDKIIIMAMNELNRYYSVTKLLEVPFTGCVDLTEYPEISTVVNVFRTKSIGSMVQGDNATRDPLVMSQLQMYNFGSGYYSTNWIHNYLGYSTMQRMANTIATDLDFREDKENRKLYVTYSQGKPTDLTIEYMPRLMDPSEITHEYWQDILMRLSLAHTKIALGRVRTRYTQNGALWSSDGEVILNEGNTELSELRENLRANSDLILPLD